MAQQNTAGPSPFSLTVVGFDSTAQGVVEVEASPGFAPIQAAQVGLAEVGVVGTALAVAHPGQGTGLVVGQTAAVHPGHRALMGSHRVRSVVEFSSDHERPSR